MGTLIAVVIIIALIFYALRDLLIDKDFSAWTNIALTSLILFTVILSIFMILHNQPAQGSRAPETEKEEPAPEPSEDQEQFTDEQREQAARDLASEYVAMENECIKDKAVADCAGFTTDFIKKKYDINDEEWEIFLNEAETSGLLQSTRAAQTGGK
ncbi:MAG: hypothetical protein LBG16_05580 [Elusimicrobiota bacterium]|jgi:hypothetical protein|nr:hypothetical protein [Elusimicrobiota bacterium]